MDNVILIPMEASSTSVPGCTVCVPPSTTIRAGETEHWYKVATETVKAG